MSMENLGPYSNFHELNQDWFLNEFNKVIAQWKAMQKNFDNLQDAFNDLKNYVKDYFKNLNVQDEINKKLDDMIKDGTLSEIINTAIGNDYISIKNYGCVGDGVTDDTEGITKAINYCIANNKILFIPLGDYVIKSDLPDLPEHFTIKGVSVGNKINGYASRIIDLRQSTTPLLNLVIEGTVGGSIEDIIFDDKNHVPGKTCIYRKRGGWTFFINRCSFFSYDTALYLIGDDGRINDCQFALCGSNTKIANNPKYCVILDQSNEKRFNGCHFEHSRFMVHILGSSYFNTFENCKFEQGTNNSNVDSTLPVIWIESTQYNYTNTFNNCAFHAIDIEYYIEHNIVEKYEDIPYMITSKNDSNIIINGCSFVTGPGSGETIYKQFSQGKFLKCVFAQIDNCAFIRPAYLTYALEFTNAILNNISFEMYFTGSYSLSASGENTLINRTFYPYNFYNVSNAFIKLGEGTPIPVVLDNNGTINYMSNISQSYKCKYNYFAPYMTFEIHPLTSPFNGVWDVTVLNPLEGYNFGTFSFAVESNKITIIDTTRFIRHDNYNITIGIKNSTIYVFIPGSKNNSRDVVFRNEQPCNIYINSEVKNILDDLEKSEKVWK